MASLKAMVRDRLSQLVFKELTIEDARDVTPSFRRFRVGAPWLRAASCAPGDKLQIMILEAGTRTYSPFAHDPERGTLDLLAYVHGDTPGAAWIKAAQAGLRFRAFGPRGSLALGSLQGPVVFFGDETGLGAAASLQAVRGASAEVSFVFECTQPAEAASASAEVGLRDPVLVQRQPGHAHVEAIATALGSALSRAPRAHLVLTGHAQSIQAIRARLKAQGVAAAGQATKAYWADGKRGLD